MFSARAMRGPRFSPCVQRHVSVTLTRSPCCMMGHSMDRLGSICSAQMRVPVADVYLRRCSACFLVVWGITYVSNIALAMLYMKHELFIVISRVVLDSCRGPVG